MFLPFRINIFQISYQITFPVHQIIYFNNIFIFLYKILFIYNKTYYLCTV
jgi:hypothetical protein